MLKNHSKFLTSSPLFLVLCLPFCHGAYVIEQLNGPSNQGNAGTGQSFTPSVGIVDDPGDSTSTIDLTSFSLYSAGTGGNGSRGTSYLLIYDANPSGTANLIGASDTTLDLGNTSALTTTSDAQLTWSFDNLTLDYDTKYYAVISQDSTGSLGTGDIGLGFKRNDANPYAGGNALTNNFAEAGGADLKFSASLSSPVSAIPEPSGVLALGFLFGASMLSRRR